jgi:hypothetical protein
MNADSELLIKIKTILESQGIDAAKAKIAELSATTNTEALSQAAANSQRSKAETQAEKTAKAILSMNSAMAGGLGPFRAAIVVANQLGGSFATLAFKVSAVGAAMTIGFKLGNTLRDWVTGAKEVEGEMEKIKTISDELRTRISKLNDIRLNNLKTEAKAIADGFSTAVDKAERLKRLSDLREDAELARDLAGVNLRFQKGEINEPERDRLELKFQMESEQRKNKSEEKRITTQEELSSNSVSSEIVKNTDLRYKARMAKSEYADAIQTYKDNGGVDADSVISSGFNSSEYEDAMKKARADLKKAREFLDYYGKPDQSRIDKAQKKFDSLSDLPGLKTVSDVAQKDLEAHSPVLQKTIQDEALKKEQLDADKAVLGEKYRTSSTKFDAGNAAIEAKIKGEVDKAIKDARSPVSTARDAGKMILESVGVRSVPVYDNAGLPVSQGRQNQIDDVRLTRAQNAVMKATNDAYHGGDVKDIVDKLIKALEAQNARLVGAVRKEDLIPILNTVKNLQSQNTVSRGVDQ